MPPISRQVSAGAAGEGEGEVEVEAGRNFGSGLFVCGEAGPVWVRPRRRLVLLPRPSKRTLIANIKREPSTEKRLLYS